MPALPDPNPSSILDGNARQQIHVVVVGHVDHGKSTVIGRLMAELGGLPDGKIEQIRTYCARNARPFEFAFLLDALKNEQSQGITIETARCFFRTEKRDYIVHDAPGHVEFLKNMVTGASRAEAAFLVIDVKEGIQENSRRHGYLISMLGVRQVAILVNKMDLVGYDAGVFEALRSEYRAFLGNLGVAPLAFIPISAREGVNITTRSSLTSWYDGATVREQLDSFEKNRAESVQPFRMPVQDIYRFTEERDDRRIVAGTVESGRIRVGEEVSFWPSGKISRVATVEGFNQDVAAEVQAGQAVGITLDPQVYVTAGELMCRRTDPAPACATRFRANIFWLGASPMIPGKRYKLKIGAARTPVQLVQVQNIVDASDLSSVRDARQINRHDVAECILETARPIAYDRVQDLERTARFVIVDGYDIAACGTVLQALESGSLLLQEQVRSRERRWQKGFLSELDRAARNGHKGKFIVITGRTTGGIRDLARHLEKRLFLARCQTYYLTIENLFEDLRAPEASEPMAREEHLERLGEIAHLMADSGLLFITALEGLSEHEVNRLRILSQPHQLFVINMRASESVPADVVVEPGSDHASTVATIIDLLSTSGVLPDYEI
ncbi:MAG: GTP-binding protein [Acidobacteriota bacterium]